MYFCYIEKFHLKLYNNFAVYMNILSFRTVRNIYDRDNAIESYFLAGKLSILISEKSFSQFWTWRINYIAINFLRNIRAQKGTFLPQRRIFVTQTCQ